MRANWSGKGRGRRGARPTSPRQPAASGGRVAVARRPARAPDRAGGAGARRRGRAGAPAPRGRASGDADRPAGGGQDAPGPRRRRRGTTHVRGRRRLRAAGGGSPSRTWCQPRSPARWASATCPARPRDAGWWRRCATRSACWYWTTSSRSSRRRPSSPTSCGGARRKIVVTSREALRVSGEQEYRVAPLALPNPDALPPVERLGEYGAVRLFVERGRPPVPGFRLTTENVRAVAETCVRREGLPLALELAAARSRSCPQRGSTPTWSGAGSPSSPGDTRRAGAPPLASGGDFLELRPPGPARAGSLPAPGGVRGRLHARRRGRRGRRPAGPARRPGPRRPHVRPGGGVGLAGPRPRRRGRTRGQEPRPARAVGG